MRDDRLYLIHIKECIDWIEGYVADGADVFMRDRKTQDAVLRNLQTLSESTQRLSDNLKNKYPAVDWRAISSLRNVIAHDYLGVNLKRIWEIVTVDLPVLKNDVAEMLGE